MNMLDSITARKSFKTFTERDPGDELIDRLADYMSGLTLPSNDIDWNFDTLPKVDLVRVSVRGPGVNAPRFLVLRSERVRDCLQNIGYLGELAALWLTCEGVATAWQGSVQIDPRMDFEGSLSYISCIAFGYSEEPFRASAAEAQRLPVSGVVFGATKGRDDILEAGRLAPSYMNRQMTRFVCDEFGNIHIYRKKALLNNPVLTFQDCVSVGAAMAHLEIAAKETGHSAHYEPVKPVPQFKNFIYQNTLRID